MYFHFPMTVYNISCVVAASEGLQQQVLKKRIYWTYISWDRKVYVHLPPALSASSYKEAPSLSAALVFDGYAFGSPADTHPNGQ